jgi:CRP-like cAMP-binding protein
MTNQQLITDYVSKFVTLTAGEANVFSSKFKTVKVKKRQIIIQPGFVTNYRYYIVSGALRAYVIGDEGQEHTVQLAIDDWWISDYNSYIFQQPASMFVMAVEDCELLQLHFEDEQFLKSANHKFETFFRSIAERSVAFMQRRFISNLTMSAEERYDLFINKYPLIATRFPQYVIASYNGMSTEFLSKIRNNKLKRKS